MFCSHLFTWICCEDQRPTVVCRSRNLNQVTGEQLSCVCHLILQCCRVGTSFIEHGRCMSGRLLLVERVKYSFTHISMREGWGQYLEMLLCISPCSCFHPISAASYTTDAFESDLFKSLCAYLQEPLAQGNLEHFGGVKYIHSCHEMGDILERRFPFTRLVYVSKMNISFRGRQKSVYHMWCPVPAGHHLRTMEFRRLVGPSHFWGSLLIVIMCSVSLLPLSCPNKLFKFSR